MTATPIAGARPWFPEADVAEAAGSIAEVLRSGRLILGPRLRRLEEAFAARVGVRHAVGVASCTAALEIAFRHLDVRGREVVVPTNTFVATANAVLAAGGRPVFCDMDAADFGIGAEDALSRLGPHTAAVVVVHVAGLVASGLDRVRSECRRRGIAVVEDCAHAHGARWEGREVGALGDVGCFSFYPTKILTCGTGGMLTTDDDGLAAFARSVRHHGQGGSLEDIVLAGNDWLLDEVRCVLAELQLRRLDEFLAVRRRLARDYDRLLAAHPDITPPPVAPGTEPAYYKYPVLLPGGVDRSVVVRRLRDAHAIEAGAVYSPPCHLMPVFRRELGTGPGTLPVAEAVLPRQLALPMHARLETADAERSVDALAECLQAAG